MTTEGRVLLRVLCSREKGPHTVGKVFATPAGYSFEYIIKVQGVDGPFGQSHTEILGEDAIGSTAWCTACGKGLPVSTLQVRAAVLAGHKVFRLQAEGMFVDPNGVIARKIDRLR